jgi:hypothetical protein
VAPKKTDNQILRQNLYLNFGLLGIATLLGKSGQHVRMCHGEFRKATDIATKVLNEGREGDLVFLSLPSVFALPWASDFVEAIREAGKSLPVAVGGRWVVGDDPEWVRRRLPPVDLVFSGTAESSVAVLSDASTWHDVERRQALSRAIPKDPVPSQLIYDYAAMEEFKRYQPSVEISRGCGFGCSFCVDAYERLAACKSVDQVLREIDVYEEAYGASDLRPYFEASLFRPSSEWARTFAAARARRASALRWRCESRVDVWSRDVLTALRDAGLSVVDAGLDSADTTQLIRMNKTRKPEEYLGKADQLLMWCDELGITVKLNVLLYAGETGGSWERTRCWLLDRSHYIKGVSVNPLIAYRSDVKNAAFMTTLAEGGAVVDLGQIELEGYCRVAPSREVSAWQADSMALALSRELMTARDYFELKAFSYFPRDFTYAQFEDLAFASEPSTLPFRLHP